MAFTRGVRLGVDVGNARVGVAKCDPDGILATPLKTLRRDAKKNSDRKVLRTLIRVNEVTEVFVGLPRTMRGGESPSTEMAKTYAQALVHELYEEGITIPVWLVDERLTTVSAHRSLHEAGVSTRDFKTMVDQVAAINILQFAVDSLKAGQNVAGYKVEIDPSLAIQDADSAHVTAGDEQDTENPS
ncbi:MULTISPECIES: Holliday junction resolvase RuvX [Rothia]|uniref:Putative pre-16S rRNA nuclease n=1 Tax=Rothia amarae TaxID=169480 RepID=A0A7H2BH26_9MICC|nr:MULTISPECIES: Holliday junction resolvase RuvX [Rothia]QNV38972.1 Holliday junction resolvase RuvX [Rothia amarae]SIL06676.1 Holliday junction resolvase-like protein [Mycobacteroides abscessus subsp. abscessus]